MNISLELLDDYSMADIIAREYDLWVAQGEAQTPRQSLDETTAETDDVSGGSPNGSQLLGIRLCDLSLNKACVDGYSNMYAFTFTYDPESKHSIDVEDGPATKVDDEQLFWEAVLKKPQKKVKIKKFGELPFLMQYKIFKKHFARWEKQMTNLLDQKVASAILGYTVCIELTKSGNLHAHGMIYSNNNYKDMYSSTARTLWAQISKGRVVAMKKAFELASSQNSWKKYVTKDLNKII